MSENFHCLTKTIVKAEKKVANAAAVIEIYTLVKVSDALFDSLGNSVPKLCNIVRDTADYFSCFNFIEISDILTNH